MPEKDIASARKTAFLCIKNSLYAGWELQAGLDKALNRQHLSFNDQNLATELVYGYLRFKGRLDYILSCFLHSPHKVPRDISIALGLAVYELIFLDRIPFYASVHYWVEQIKKDSPKLAKLANAVLRKVADNKTELENKDFYQQDNPSKITFLSRYYSCPQWIIQILFKDYAEQEVHTFLKAGLKAPPVGLRFNKRHPEYHSTLNYYANLPACILCQEPGLAFSKTPRQGLAASLEQGICSRQSISSQKALLDLEPGQWPQPIWDACAGKGGKTGFLLEMGLGSVWVSDLSQNRLKICDQEIKRLGLEQALLFKADLCQEAPLKFAPGTILLDAPCSGLGVLSRRPDSKWKRTRQDCRQLIKIQARMLEKAYQTLQPGGLLAYLTCTCSRAENEGQIQELLARYPRAELEAEQPTPVKKPWGEFFYTALIKKTGGYRPPL